MAYVALTRHRDGVALYWSADELGSREGLTRTLGRERLKDTSLDYGDSQDAAAAGSEDAAAITQAFSERRGLHPLVPVSRIVLWAGQAAARRTVSLATLARRRVERQTLKDGLRPLLEMLREQAQMLDRLVAEHAPVLQAWRAIATQPRVLAELERCEASLRHRWDDDFLRQSAAGWRQRPGLRALQEPTNRLAAEAVLIGYARGAAAAEQAWRTTPAVTAEPEGWLASAWATYEPRPQAMPRPSRDVSPGPSPG